MLIDKNIDQAEKKKQQQFGTFVAASILWLICIFLIANSLDKGISELKPNEFGDVLAGTFAPLAAAWFVYAVSMQREELRLQRIEMKNQIRELSLTRSTHEESVNENKRAVEQFNIQTEIARK